MSTKIHAAVDALGNPVRFLVTAGQASEYGQADALIEGVQADFVLADKGYDSDAFIEKVKAGGAVAVGVDGLFMETHPQPDKAFSDGPNAWPLDKIEMLLKQLIEIDRLIKEHN